ncbi:MAG TPA: class I adenylate-forming enzyme family protein [Steroidobacteraceae bacterium]
MPRLDAMLARAALSEPRRDAIIFRDTIWSYAEVYDRACRLASALAALGVRKGDRVAFWAANRPEFVEVLFGVPILGAIASPLDHWWTWKDAYAAIEQIRPKVLIVGASQAAAIIGCQDEMQAAGIQHVLCLEERPAEANFDLYALKIASAARFAAPVPVGPGDPALILFTSGSTGRSKGSVHTHRSLVAAAMTMSLELDLHDGERTLHFLPLFSSCLEQLIPLTLMRATHIILPQFDAPAVWEAILRFKVTHFDAVPTTLRRLLDAAPPTMPKSLRSISYASERMPAPLITALIEGMPEVRFVQFYGMMEHLCLTVLQASDQLRKIGTVGRPMLGAQLYLLHAEDHASTSRQPGEIVAHSPTLFAGYWQDEAATAQVMRGEWMRTGDIGHFDEEGFLTLEGRVKEMIKTGGLTVIPTEIESLLMGHPNVSDAAVVGVPDARWGEAVHAFVTLSPGATTTESDLRLFCQERLAGYKRPKVIHIVSEMPRTGIGKIARRLVRDRIFALRAE